MISCDRGEIRIQGRKSDIKAELSCLLRSIVTIENILTRKDLDDCIEFVELTDEEIEMKAKKDILSLIFNELLLKTLKDAYEKNEEEEENEDV